MIVAVNLTCPHCKKHVYSELRSKDTGIVRVTGNTDVDAIIAEVCAGHVGVEPKDLMGRNKPNRVSRVRHIVWRELFNKGLLQADIAGLFGVDHRTVSYGLSKTGDK